MTAGCADKYLKTEEPPNGGVQQHATVPQRAHQVTPSL